MENDQDKKDIYKEREKYRQRAFFMMLEVGIILAVPAFLALFLGKYLDKSNQTGDTITLILLGIAFILSWAIIIRKYIKFNKKIKEIDRKIKESKEDVDNPN